jgi:MFS superfamily sulfate permease-like transporter
VDDVTWGALTLTLTLLGGIWTWKAFRRRGPASGLRAAGFTLLPAAAWLTHTLQLFTEILGAVGDWATSLVFNPFTWLGIALAGVSVVLFGASSFLSARQLGGRPDRPARELGAGKPAAGKPASGKGAPAIDDDLAEIEALLRKRGIS